MKKLLMALAAVISAVVTFNASADYAVSGTMGENAATFDVIPGSAYAWYRFSFRQGYTSDNGDMNVSVQEFGLFDETDHRVAYGPDIEIVSPDAVALQPGQACWTLLGNAGKRVQDYGARGIDKALDDKVGTYPLLAALMDSSLSQAFQVEKGVPTTWFGLVLRPKTGTPLIASYDVCANGKKPSDGYRYLGGWGLEASADGASWDLLDEKYDQSTSVDDVWHVGSVPLTSTQDGGTHKGYPIPAYAGGTFKLSGESGTEGTLTDVEDGLYKTLSVEKDGEGVWTLKGKQSFSGDLTVKAGTLKVDPSVPYTWFRFVVEQGGTGDANVDIQELGFFDAEGYRQNVGLTEVAACSQASLQPGQMCWDVTGVEYYTTRGLPQCVDDQYDVGQPLTFMRQDVKRQDVKPDPDHEETWTSFTMRMKADAKAIASYDVCHCPLTDNSLERSCRGWSLWGSVDGVNYVMLDRKRDQPAANRRNYWNDGKTPLSDTQGGKTYLNGTPVGELPVDGCLANVASITVAHGAKIEALKPVTLSRLTPCLAGNGTYAGFAFAEEGVIELSETSPNVYSMTFENCTGLENLKDWQVKANGVLKKNWWVEVVPEGLRVCCKGLVLVVR